MDTDNMSKREGKMTVGKRRILIAKLVGNTTDYVLQLKNGEMRVSCFQRTRCLITMLPVEDMDAKIKLQGIEEGTFAIPKTKAVLHAQVVEGNAQVNEGYATLDEETVNIEEDSNDDKIVLDSEK